MPRPYRLCFTTNGLTYESWSTFAKLGAALDRMNGLQRPYLPTASGWLFVLDRYTHEVKGERGIGRMVGKPMPKLERVS